ncbi:MAG TPA: lipopolysaccharide assembly protein LapA domain-containing protein [Acidimicrobiales bacterium]|jgi:uncharacterized integral membrane protein
MDDEDEAGATPNDTEATGNSRSTRSTGVWMATVVVVLFGVALIDFIAQNTRHVRISFFGVHAQIPVSVALLAAAIAGAIVVLAIGIGRAAYVRLSGHRSRAGRRERRSSPAPRP